MQRSNPFVLFVLACAALPASAQIKSVTVNAPARASAKGAPLTKQECDRFALSFEEFVRTKDWQHAEGKFDWDALYARATNGIPAPDRTRAAFRGTADTYYRGAGGLVAGLIQSVTSGGSIHYLHTFEADEETRIVFRLTRRGDEVPDYVVIPIESGPNGAAVGTDIATTSEGDLASARLRRYFLGLSAGATRALEEKVQGVDALRVRHEKDLDAADEAFRAGRNQEALAKLEALPEVLKSDSGVVLDRLNAARALSMETFRIVLERVRAQHEANPAVERIALDAFLATKSFEDACRAARGLDAAVGGDAYLDWVVATIQDDAGQVEEAIAACKRAIGRDEHLQEPWWTLLSLFVRNARHEETLQVLNGIAARFEVDWRAIERAPEYQAFFSSEYGHTWTSRPAKH